MESSDWTLGDVLSFNAWKFLPIFTRLSRERFFL